VIPAATGALLTEAEQKTSARISWPAFFEPKLMACGPAHDDRSSFVAALTPRGYGAVARVGSGEQVSADHFKLAGLSHLPPMLGASWGSKPDVGLLLVSRMGDLAACPGVPPAGGGVWRCNAPVGAPQKLPVAAGMRLLAATVARVQGHLHAALVHESMPEMVALFAVQQEDTADPSWLPLGEVPVPRGPNDRVAEAISLAFVDESDLLVTTGTGHVLRRRLQDGAVVASAPHAQGGDAWRSACNLQHGQAGSIAHLRMPSASISRTERFPEVIVSTVPLMAAVDEQQPAVFE